HADLRIDRGRGLRRRVAYGERDHVLPAVVDGDVLAWLEEAQLANAFGRDAAGGEVGDTAPGEIHAGVPGVGFAGEDGQADGADLFHGRLHEREHDVEIVDHQVQYYVDVERARGEDAHAVDLEEHGLGNQRDCRADCRVEAFQMSNLGDAFFLCG